jgi:hypothetical protein
MKQSKLGWNRSVIIGISTRNGFVFANIFRLKLELSDVEVGNLWSLYLSSIIRLHVVALNRGHLLPSRLVQQFSSGLVLRRY